MAKTTRTRILFQDQLHERVGSSSSAVSRFESCLELCHPINSQVLLGAVFALAIHPLSARRSSVQRQPSRTWPHTETAQDSGPREGSIARQDVE